MSRGIPTEPLMGHALGLKLIKIARECFVDDHPAHKNREKIILLNLMNVYFQNWDFSTRQTLMLLTTAFHLPRYRWKDSEASYFISLMAQLLNLADETLTHWRNESLKKTILNPHDESIHLGLQRAQLTEDPLLAFQIIDHLRLQYPLDCRLIESGMNLAAKFGADTTPYYTALLSLNVNFVPDHYKSYVTYHQNQHQEFQAIARQTTHWTPNLTPPENQVFMSVPPQDFVAVAPQASQPEQVATPTDDPPIFSAQEFNVEGDISVQTPVQTPQLDLSEIHERVKVASVDSISSLEDFRLPLPSELGHLSSIPLVPVVKGVDEKITVQSDRFLNKTPSESLAASPVPEFKKKDNSRVKTPKQADAPSIVGSSGLESTHQPHLSEPRPLSSVPLLIAGQNQPGRTPLIPQPEPSYAQRVQIEHRVDTASQLSIQLQTNRSRVRKKNTKKLKNNLSQGAGLAFNNELRVDNKSRHGNAQTKQKHRTPDKPVAFQMGPTQSPSITQQGATHPALAIDSIQSKEVNSLNELSDVSILSRSQVPNIETLLPMLKEVPSPELFQDATIILESLNDRLDKPKSRLTAKELKLRQSLIKVMATTPSSVSGIHPKDQIRYLKQELKIASETGHLLRYMEFFLMLVQIVNSDFYGSLPGQIIQMDQLLDEKRLSGQIGSVEALYKSLLKIVKVLREKGLESHVKSIREKAKTFLLPDSVLWKDNLNEIEISDRRKLHHFSLTHSVELADALKWTNEIHRSFLNKNMPSDAKAKRLDEISHSLFKYGQNIRGLVGALFAFTATTCLLRYDPTQFLINSVLDYYEAVADLIPKATSGNTLGLESVLLINLTRDTNEFFLNTINYLVRRGRTDFVVIGEKIENDLIRTVNGPRSSTTQTTFRTFIQRLSLEIPQLRTASLSILQLDAQKLVNALPQEAVRRKLLFHDMMLKMVVDLQTSSLIRSPEMTSFIQNLYKNYLDDLFIHRDRMGSIDPVVSDLRKLLYQSAIGMSVDPAELLRLMQAESSSQSLDDLASKERLNQICQAWLENAKLQH